jgi:hypothetical protein
LCYEDENNCKLHAKNSIELNNIYPEYNDWGINRILKHKETMCSKPPSVKINSLTDKEYRRKLSNYTNVNFNKIKNIRNGTIDLSYLFDPKHILNFKECDMDIYNDDILKYSCLLFDEYGIDSLYGLYNGWFGVLDIEEHPEEKKSNTFYFYKEVQLEHTSKIENVINYGEIRTEKKKIWVSCYMNDFVDYLYYLDDSENDIYKYNIPSIQYQYISDEDFKYFVKETLIELFSNRIKKFELSIDCETNNIFTSTWKNSDDKICWDRFTQSHYLLGKNDIVFWSQNKLYAEDIITQSEREIPLNKKLTEEQENEYSKFIDEKNESIKILNYKLKYCEFELLKIKELSLSSDTITSVVQICKYLFEYNDELIEYFKHNISLKYANIEKHAMERHAFMEDSLK